MHRAFLLLLLVAGCPRAAAETLYFARGQDLLVLDTRQSGRSAEALALSGIPAGDTLVGLDFHGATTRLLAVSSRGGLFEIDLAGRRATPVRSFSMTGGLGTGPFGVDYESSTESLRIVGTGFNTMVSTWGGWAQPARVPNYAANDPGVGSTPKITAIAFALSGYGDPRSVLFGIDSARGTLVRIGSAPSDDGVVSTVGPVGVAPGDAPTLDISTASGTARAVLGMDAARSLCRVNLATGSASLVGATTGLGAGALSGGKSVAGTLPRKAPLISLPSAE